MSTEVLSDNDDQRTSTASPENRVLCNIGQRKAVWRYFDRFKSGSKKEATCKIIDSAGQTCGHVMSGWGPNNAEFHLKTHHNVQYKLIEEENQNAKKRKAGEIAGQSTLENAGGFTKTSKYSTKNPAQTAITKQLALAFNSNSLAHRLIEDHEFRKALFLLNPQYQPPSAYLLGKEIGHIFDDMKKNVSESISNATKIAITADIWTKRGMTESFLGITGHWYDKKKRCRRSAVLAVKSLTGPHVAELVKTSVETVLAKWNISPSMVSHVVTDNGSNMVKAFQEAQENFIRQTTVDIDEDGNEDLLPLAAVSTFLDVGLEESFVESNDEEITGEVAGYDYEENQLDLVFFSMERLSCFAHRLQCCVRELDKGKFASSGLKSAFKLITSVNHSHQATKMLIDESGKKLLACCPTRWSYTLLAIERLQELKSAITKVTETITKIDNLRNSDWNDIERYIKFMKPFASATYSLEGQNYTTISEVMTQIRELQLHLSEMKHIIGFKIASESMEKIIAEKFGQILNPEHPNYQVIYAVAQSLDPRYCLLLRDDELAAAKAKILNLLGYYDGISTNDTNQYQTAASSLQPSKFRFVSSLIKSKHEQQQRHKESESAAVKEVTAYFGCLPYEENQQSDPLVEYWPDRTNTFPLLASLAFDILIIPATSAPVERVFSQASIALGQKRIRLTGENLELQVMTKCNLSFLD